MWTDFTFSLCISCLSNSLSFWAFASLCKSDGSFRSLLKENAGGDSESPLLDDTRVLAFSDISICSLSGKDGGAFSFSLGGTSLTWLFDVISNCLPLSAGRWICSSESSAGDTAKGPELSDEMRVGLGCSVGCLLSSEGLRRLGDLSPWGAAVVPVWLDVVDLSSSEQGTSTGVSETALTGDFGVRARLEGRPGATLGLIENRFLLWTAAEELVPSPFWSLPSLRKVIFVIHNKSRNHSKIHFRSHLMLVSHPGAVGFSDGVTTDLLSVTAVAVLLSLTLWGFSLASWFTEVASWVVAGVLPAVPTLGRILNLDRRNILTWKHTWSQTSIIFQQ